MDSFSHFLDLIAQAKTPLAIGGLIAAALVGLLWQIAKNTSIGKDTLKLIVIGAFGLAGLVLVLGFIGFMLPPPGPHPQPNPSPPPPVATAGSVSGTVYSDAGETAGVTGATVMVEPDLANLNRQAAVTDGSGDFHVQFSGGGSKKTTAQMWITANGYQQTSRQVVDIVPEGQDATRLRIVLQRPVVVASADPTPHVTVTTSDAPANAVKPATWAALHTAIKGDKLKLGNAATDAFTQGNYKVAASFLEEAGKLSGGTWQGSYPTLAASYYLSGKPELGKAELSKMELAIRDDMQSGKGYFSSIKTLNFVLEDLQAARARVPDTAKPDFDEPIAYVGKVIKTHP